MILMAHTITLTDEQYDRLRGAAEVLHRTPDQVVADLLGELPVPRTQLPHEEYERRWDSFFQLVGSITLGVPITNEEIDEVIGEEASNTHDDRSTGPDCA
jgi:hypothetical protein